MKSLLYLFFILGFSLLGATTSTAQVGGEGRMGNGGGYWIFGLNAGGAWQDSDIKARPGGGWGFYIGHSIYNPKNAFLSADLRFRYMNTYTYGQNHKDNLFGNLNLADTLRFGYQPTTKAFANNHETIFHDLSLELRVNFEKLRRKTNIWLSLYAGGGLGIYGSRFDQKDANGNDYDYESINQNQSDRDICRDIIAMRDGNYETNAFDDNFGDNLFRLTFTPSVGIELGYWFTPYFALGIGHRVTFTLQDNFEGVTINNGKAINSSIHHYTALMFHWRVTGAKSEKEPCPEIRFELPTSNSARYTTDKPTVFIKATITNVREDQITYTVNGQSNRNFTYDSQSDVFQSNLNLQKGENRVVIKAKNSCGVDAQAIIINYEPKDKPKAQPPIVSITNPGANGTVVMTPTVNVYAQILHVASKNNVVFSVNGNTGQNFSFSGTSFQANNVSLVPGQNTITIRGTNRDGSDSKSIVVTYQKEEPLPIVTITNPNANPYTVSTSRINLSATILNVRDQSGVIFNVNGQNSTNFSFSGTTFQANNIVLIKGRNTLIVTGRNAKGQDTKSTVVIYEEEALPPVVNITRPNQNPYTTSTASVTINASILNVTSPSNVTYNVNGQSRNDFSFSGTNFSANLNLIQGSNTITITGRNKDGQDTKSTVIIYQKAVLRPVVTITNPGANPFTTTAQNAGINATITNVDTRNGVNCTVNGQTNNNFSFNNNSFSLNNLSLIKGNNTITITGRNQAGQDTKSTVIIYRPVVVERPPVVTITNPRANPYRTQSSKGSVSATISNVTGKSNVTCTVNGQPNASFSFTGSSFVLGKLGLEKGSNSITITGRNSVGQDSKTTIIIYEPVVQIPRPVVTILEPNQNPYNTKNATINLVASILNVSSKNDVTFTVNGQNNTGFSLSGTSFTASNLGLKEGNNTISITGRNSAGQDSKTTVIVYRKPIQEPSVVIKSPNQNPLTVQNAQINLTATILNVPSKNGVTFTVNGQINNGFSFSGTSFVANNIALVSGSNTFTISGRNKAGQATASTVVVYRPITPPVVTFTIPNQSPWTTTADVTTISATVRNVTSKNDVTFQINGQTSTNFSFNNNVLTANNVALNVGNNTFTVTGRNAGGQDSKSTIIARKKLTPRPIVTITEPNRNPFNTQTDRITINANIVNVQSQNDVTFTMNGQAASFSFSKTNFVAPNVRLNPGNNTFVITGRNVSGQDSKTAMVIYKEPILEPVVTITTPVQNPFTTLKSKENITATILNVASKNDVTFTVNGQNNTNFTFNGTAFIANNLGLNVGSNTIAISGRNSAGQATKSTVIVYKLPEKKPTVVITAPAQNPFNTQANRVNIAATILAISNKNQVVFTVNGQNNTNFTFSGTSFVANNVALNQGNNTFVITAKNGAGQATASTVVVYSIPVQEPTVVITAPAQNPFNTRINEVNIAATIKNVSGKNNVTFTVNGQAMSNFTFNNTSFVANEIALKPGNNTFTVTGRNASGQATATTVVIYTPFTTRPVIVYTSPSTNPFNTSSVKINIQANIQHVARGKDLILTVNGTVVPKFTFSGTSFEAKDVLLNSGNNDIMIRAVNNRGAVTGTTAVVLAVTNGSKNNTLKGTKGSNVSPPIKTKSGKINSSKGGKTNPAESPVNKKSGKLDGTKKG